jgi:hypothetical protein
MLMCNQRMAVTRARTCSRLVRGAACDILRSQASRSAGRAQPTPVAVAQRASDKSKACAREPRSVAYAKKKKTPECG